MDDLEVDLWLSSEGQCHRSIGLLAYEFLIVFHCNYGPPRTVSPKDGLSLCLCIYLISYPVLYIAIDIIYCRRLHSACRRLLMFARLPCPMDQYSLTNLGIDLIWVNDLTLIWSRGGGVILPPGRSFSCRSVTAWSFEKRLGDFVRIWFVFKLVYNIYSYHHPGLHYGGRNLETDLELHWFFF